MSQPIGNLHAVIKEIEHNWAAKHMLVVGDVMLDKYISVSYTHLDVYKRQMDNNFTCSKEILGYAIEQGAPLIYASTAAVYGLSGPGHLSLIHI